MPIVIGPQLTDFPFSFAMPTIEKKLDPTDDWQLDPDLTLVSCALHASSHAISTCELERRYGKVKMPFENDYPSTNRSPLDLTGYWVRVSITGDEGQLPIFVGKVEGGAKSLEGQPTLPSGHQRWVAAGGLRILEKIQIHRSIFLNGDLTESEVDWVPAMNGRDKRNLLVGNRSDTASDAGYFYGGKSVWSHYQYLNYLVDNFVQTFDATGEPAFPVWTVGGQASVLDKIQTTIKFPQNASVLHILSELIPPKYGLDFFIVPNDEGFEIRVFAISSEEESIKVGGSSAAAVTMPKNPNTVRLEKSSAKDLFETQMVETTERRCDLIQVVGKRIVVCGTLRGANAGASGATPTLVPKWNTVLSTSNTPPFTIESDYIAAGGLFNPDGTVPVSTPAGQADPEAADAIRRREKYNEVYQHYGAPKNWDMDNGKWAVACNDDGSLTNAQQLTDAYKKANPNAVTTPKFFQTAIRETLSWVPLMEGFDYSTNPPTDNRLDTSVDPEMQRPRVWAIDEISDPIAFDTNSGFLLLDQHGISMHKPNNDWGVFLSATPNHKLALNHWTDAQIATSEHDPEWDYLTLAATIAIESDHRLKLAYKVPSSLAAGDGSVMTIVDEEAECWVLLPGTAVDTDTDANLVEAPPTKPSTDPKALPIEAGMMVLRKDTPRLALALAGAIARYKNDRLRSSFTFKGFFPAANLLGQVLYVYASSDDQPRGGAPVTTVEYILSPTPQTIVKTGYA